VLTVEPPTRSARGSGPQENYKGDHRAQTSELADAVFRDPYARKLAGDHGGQIDAGMPFAPRHSWSYAARIWLVNQIIEREVQQDADVVRQADGHETFGETVCGGRRRGPDSSTYLSKKAQAAQLS